MSRIAADTERARAFRAAMGGYLVLLQGPRMHDGRWSPSAFAHAFDQSNFEEWEALERSRLGHYPGHDAACPMRERESLLTANCGCGPKEGDE